MGWWGEGVMEGDEPQDIVCLMMNAIQEEAGIDEELVDKLDELRDSDPETYAIEQAKFNAVVNDYMTKPENVNTIIKAVEDRTAEPGWDYRVVAMAIVHELITNGWYLPDAERKAAINAAKTSPLGGWRNPRGRKMALKEFAKAVKGYKGVPVEIHTRGLFEMIGLGLRDNQPWPDRVPVRKSKKQLRKQRRRNKPWSN